MAPAQQSKHNKTDGPEGTVNGGRNLNNPDRELNLVQNPLDKSFNPLNVLLFLFIQPLIVLGSKRPLEMADMIRLPHSDQTQQAWKRLKATLDAEKKLITDGERKKVAETQKTGGWRLLRALYRANGIQSLYGGVSLLIWVCVYGFQPLFVRAILNKIVQKHDPIFGNVSNLGLWLTLLCFALVQIVFLNHGFFWMYRFAFRLRSAVMNFVYRKAIKLSSTSKLSQSSGNIVTLMSVDPMLVFGGTVPQHWIWLGPVLIVLSMSLLTTELGPISVVPVGMMIIMASVQIKLFNLISITRRAVLKKTDKRISVITEILSGIRIIKSYAWEKRAAQQVQGLREQETTQLRRLLYLQAANQVIFFISPPLIGIGAFLTYQYFYGDITVDKVIVVLAYTNLLRLPMAIMPRAIGQFIESLVSIRRLEKFYFFNEEVIERQPFATIDEKDKRAIAMVDSEFSWDSTLNESEKKKSVNTSKSLDEGTDRRNESSSQTIGQPFKLFIDNLVIEKGQLCIICGTVGSGKTSLLSAILGEMTINRNKCFVNGAISYVAQRPWIQNSTVKDGVLFARDFEKAEYESVLRAAQLDTDIRMLPHGDATEIGERGINLSGGQKQRVAIARALYKSDKKDIFLLDDPLSAVDVHVANKLWESAIGNNGILKGKTRVLILNSHYHLLKEADLVCVMDGGRLAFAGTSEDAIKKFPSLLAGEDHVNDNVLIDRINSAGVNVEEEKEDRVEDVRDLKKFNSEASEVNIERTVSSAVEDSKEGDDKDSQSKKLYNKEDRAKGRVKCGTYLAWFRSASSFGNGIPWALFIVLLYLTAQVGRTGSDFLLTNWADNPTTPSLVLYISLTLVTFVFLIARGFLFMYTSVSASKNFHNKIFSAVLKAPINLFFDVTKTGQIINRFSSDMDHVDVQLPTFGIQFFQNSIYVFAAVVVCGISNIWFIPFLIPIGFIYYISQSYYRKSSREVKRLEGISRSPIFAGFQEMLNGVETIRAFDQSNQFIYANEKYVDRNNGIYMDFQMCSRWLALRLDVVGISIFCTHYTKNIPLEKASIIKSNRPSENWPLEGAIEFKNVVMSYRPGLPQVLKKINLKIKGGEKIGVCGRTGSGKSSMIVSLLRLVELDNGSITIDGVDISKIGLSDLRSNLSLIPQEPVLFSGDVRHNLDPFDDCDDDAVWQALRNVGLDDFVKTLGNGLQSAVAEQGLNFSAGQRQLICVARALLRGNKIIIMDEATASVDSETDQKLQRMIRTAFAECTVICIAHRLDTILDSDKICVLGDGNVLEFDSPENLLKDKSGEFYALVDEMKKNKEK
eukprot:g15843.t1